jgi:lipopolysaccharide export system ATP-binding protein
MDALVGDFWRRHRLVSFIDQPNNSQAMIVDLELDGLSLSIGRITGLLGRNGSGKSRLMKAAFASHRDLSYLPQTDFIPDSLRLKRLFDDFRVDYADFEKRFPEFQGWHHLKFKELSGGEARFVATYLIICTPTPFAMLDEPFTHLMPLQIEKITELLLEEKKRKGFLITDHLYHHVVGIADSIYVLTAGKTHGVKDPADIAALGYVAMPGAHALSPQPPLH